jgi:hypothetical protein
MCGSRCLRFLRHIPSRRKVLQKEGHLSCQVRAELFSHLESSAPGFKKKEKKKEKRTNFVSPTSL